VATGRNRHYYRQKGTLVIVDDEAIAALNVCNYLFLADIQELDHNGLRLVVREGRPAGAAEPLFIGGTEISGGTRIDVTQESAAFELVWKRYVACRDERVVRVNGR
jgi:hypothetical protein